MVEAKAPGGSVIEVAKDLHFLWPCRLGRMICSDMLCHRVIYDEYATNCLEEW